MRRYQEDGRLRCHSAKLIVHLIGGYGLLPILLCGWKRIVSPEFGYEISTNDSELSVYEQGLFCW
jgi:hypothetical protein